MNKLAIGRKIDGIAVRPCVRLSGSGCLPRGDIESTTDG